MAQENQAKHRIYLFFEKQPFSPNCPQTLGDDEKSWNLEAGNGIEPF
jgi:hypothetical protein